ncbi:MAG: hypothetical protein AABY22_17490 [Nanoarchaeota archaeon]
MKKIYKYGTGDSVPEGAIYLSTIVQELKNSTDNINTVIQRFVWHYFLVEVEDKI